MPIRQPGQSRLAACERAGARYRDRAIANAAAAYDRMRHLPQILGTTPQELADLSVRGRRALIARLIRLARNSAGAGRAGHWSYDPNRHIAILGALQAERAGLAAFLRGTGRKRGTPLRKPDRVSTKFVL
jgi:hypothetical protein